MIDPDIVDRMLAPCLNEIERLRKELADAIKERDEARREVMQWMAERSSTTEMTAEYKKRGWKYLKENTNG